MSTVSLSIPSHKLYNKRLIERFAAIQPININRVHSLRGKTCAHIPTSYYGRCLINEIENIKYVYNSVIGFLVHLFQPLLFRPIHYTYCNVRIFSSYRRSFSCFLLLYTSSISCDDGGTRSWEWTCSACKCVRCISRFNSLKPCQTCPRRKDCWCITLYILIESGIIL